MTKHKVFISYHHENDATYMNSLLELNESSNIFIGCSVDMGDIDDKLPDETIRKKIRDEYLKDSTVTILLVGLKTAGRKHVDWEIFSSMYDGSINKKSGILVINLPDTYGDTPLSTAPHGIREKQLIHPSVNDWITIKSKDKYKERYPYMPDRIIDNLANDKVNISVVPWSKVNETSLRHLIQFAFDGRQHCEYVLKPMRRINS